MRWLVIRCLTHRGLQHHHVRTTGLLDLENIMLLAEALATRKDTIKEIDDLTGRLSAAVVRYEDQANPVEDAGEVLTALGRALDRLEALTVRINRANNETRLSFEGRELTVMEAIALRERLILEAKARRAAVDTIERATGASKAGRGWLTSRRAKDELRELPTVDLRAERLAANRLSEAVRRLDMTVQQRNWTTDIGE